VRVAAYIEKVLEPGERIAYRARLSPISYSPSAAIMVLGLVIALGGAQFAVVVDVGVVIVLIGLLVGIWLWLERATTEIAVTDRRVILKTGLVSRRTVEINLTRVESVDVRQSIAGRMLNFGDVIIRGTGAGVEPLHMIEAPLEFRRRVLS
jgi:uncharacterized membrane protein YdbT with pleckstrin-like domain